LAFESVRELTKLIQDAFEASPKSSNWCKHLVSLFLQVTIIYVSISVGKMAYNVEGNNTLDYSEAALCFIVAGLEVIVLLALMAHIN